MSIVVVTHNQRELTESCLQSVYTFTDYPNWELVVVDNASTDGTVELLERWATGRGHLRVVKNTKNQGFPAACNQGAQAARGQILCFLNNDTLVTPGWLSALVDELQRNPRVGLVGPTSNGVANRARVNAPYREGEEMLLWSLARRQRYFRRSLSMGAVALFCAACWRTTWDKVGGLDEDFGLGLFEDDDFSARLKEAGYQLRCRLDAYVHHFQGSSFRQMQDQAYLNLYERNRRLFWAKLDHRRNARRCR
ncbi:MAG: glycosyltransferase family 2 protein [Thermoanaerobaculum sp.]